MKNTFKTVKKSRITSATIKKYLDYFEDSFLIESAQRYDIKGKAYIETPKKYYFSDLGLRNARINFRQFEQTHSMENVIYNELRMRGYSVDVGVIPIAERDQEGKVIRKQLEVDFVCNLGSSRYYIQSAYSLPDEAKRTQEIRPFRKIDDSFKKIVVTKDIVQPHYDEYGILTVNIYDFLLDPQRTQEIRPFRKIDDSFKKIVVTKDIVQPHYDEYGILTVNIYDFLLDPQILEK